MAKSYFQSKAQRAIISTMKPGKFYYINEGHDYVDSINAPLKSVMRLIEKGMLEYGPARAKKLCVRLSDLGVEANQALKEGQAKPKAVKPRPIAESRANIYSKHLLRGFPALANAK